MEDKIDKLRQYFENKGITQEQIAEMLCVDKAYVNKLMLGKKAFGKQTARKWSDLFGLSYSWLLTGEGEMQNVSEATTSNAEAANDIPFHVYKELLNRYEIVLRENENLRVEIKNLRNGIGENADNKITISVTPEGIVASNPKLQGKTKKKFIIDAERAYDMFLSMMPDSNRKFSDTAKHNGGSKSGKSGNPGSLK